MECVVSACRVGGVDSDLRGVGQPCEREERVLVGEVFFKSPEVIWRGPPSVPDSSRTFGECMQSFYFGFDGGLRWSLQLCDVSKGSDGQCVVNSCVEVKAKGAILPEMASFEVFGSGAMPGVGTLAWANVEAEVFALVSDFHVLP